MQKRRKQKLIIVLAGISMALIAFLMDKKPRTGQASNIHPLPNLQSMGDPVTEIAIVKDIISVFKERDGTYPKYSKIKLSVPVDDRPNCLFYSYNKDGYQIAIWSGATTWVYNSANDSYYEFNKDVASFAWYDLKSNTFYNEKDAREKCGVEYTIHPVE